MTVDVCSSCDGSGEDDVSGLDCPRCNGVGLVDERDEDEEWDGFVPADEDDERDDDFDFMASIPATGDDREIWACEGAIAELRCYRDEEAETDEERAAVQRDIDRLAARLRRLNTR